MKYFELDKDEQQLIKNYEEGKFKSSPRFKQEQKQYLQYVKGALDKTKNINIRISESDLLKIKSLALKKGIPYQTMMTSLIHQYSTNQLKD